MSAFVSLVLLLLAQQRAEQRPAALLAMEDARRAIRTAEIVWSQTDASGKQMRCRGRFAHNGLTVEYLPNDQGVVSGPGRGPVSSMTEAKHLQTSDGFFSHAEGHIYCRWFSGDDLAARRLYNSFLPDIRSLGMKPSFNVTHLDDALLSYPRPGIPRDYESEVQGGMVVVRAALDTGREIVWHINPQKQWNAERVEYRRDGRLIKEMVLSLRERDGIWFPQVATLRRGPSEEVVKTWAIESATFNRPDHEQALTLTHIGVEPGMAILPQGKAAEQRMAEGTGLCPLVWDGAQGVPAEEFREAVRAGRAQYGPTFEHLRAQASSAGHDGHGYPVAPAGGASILSAETLLSEWERYVRAFVAKYDLTEEQTQKALRMLKVCQDQANRYLHKHKADFEQFHDRARKARALSGSPAARERAAIDRERRGLREPVDEIFEKRLKPQLQKLPTRAQRQAAEAKVTSQPSKPGGGNR